MNKMKEIEAGIRKRVEAEGAAEIKAKIKDLEQASGDLKKGAEDAKAAKAESDKKEEKKEEEKKEEKKDDKKEEKKDDKKAEGEEEKAEEKK